METIWAGRMKYFIESVQFRNGIIKIFATEYTLTEQQVEIDRLDRMLIKELAEIEALLDQEKEAV